MILKEKEIIFQLISEVSFKISKLGVDFINILQKVKKIMKKEFLKAISLKQNKIKKIDM